MTQAGPVTWNQTTVWKHLFSSGESHATSSDLMTAPRAGLIRRLKRTFLRKR